MPGWPAPSVPDRKPIIRYSSQARGLPGGGWEPIEASRISIRIPGRDRPITVNRYLIQRGNQMQITVYWFQSQGKVVAGEVSAKIELVRNALLKNRTDGALVRLSSPVHRSPDLSRCPWTTTGSL